MQCSKIYLLDNLVGAGQKRDWYRDAERFRGLEIDGELDLCDLLYWQVARFLALEDAADVFPNQTVSLAFRPKPTLSRIYEYAV